MNELEAVVFDKSVEIVVPGWETVLIEYTFRALSNVSWVLWKIANTEHVFQIQYQTILLKHTGNLKDHFSLTLETFRKDYRDWEKEGFPEPWMQRYQKMYSKLIK